MAAKIYRINYKSDFILTLNSDAGWAIPFCIKFFTSVPSRAYFAGFDGTTYTHCSYDPSEPTKLVVQFDDHHLPIGDLNYQIAYHFTVADFPDDTEDEVINPAAITTEIEGETYHVMLDFTGETAPEIEFSLPAYANESERIQNELQRQQNEADRIAAELQREQASAAAVQGAENVNAQLSGTTLTVTNRQGVSTSVNTKGEPGERGPVGPEGPQGETGISIVSFLPKSETATTLIYTITYSNGYTQDVAIPKGQKGDTGDTGPVGPQGQQGETGVSITGFVETGETEAATLYNITFSNGTTQQVAIPKGERGDRGPAGPTGPQGPMGDVAVITPEQQAAFTMYNTTGQNTDGPMTQKAVTDALVASSISYDNSQSGLSSNNVQGALDDLSAEIGDIGSSTNLASSLTWNHGNIQYSTGEVGGTSSDSRMYFDYVNVSSYDRIRISMLTNPTTTGTGLAWYDASRNYISGVAGLPTGTFGSEVRVLDVPTNAVYVRSCIWEDYVDGFIFQGVNGSTVEEMLNIAATAEGTSFDNSETWMESTNVQDAVDELAGNLSEVNPVPLTSSILNYYIDLSNNKWAAKTSSTYSGVYKVTGGKTYKVVADSVKNARYTFLKTANPSVGVLADYATGYTESYKIQAGTEKILQAPSDANYLYCLISSNEAMPSSVILMTLAEMANDAADNAMTALVRSDGIFDIVGWKISCYLNHSNGVWTPSSANTYGYVYPICGGSELTIIQNSTYNGRYFFLRTCNPVNGAVADMCAENYMKVGKITEGTIVILEAPNDANFLYFTHNNGFNEIPAKILGLRRLQIIDFVGDSMTQRGISNSIPMGYYPSKLLALIGGVWTGTNIGYGGENVATILGRSNAIPMILASDVAIPADTSSVTITLTNAFGHTINMLTQRDSTNKVTIDNIAGTLTNTGSSFKFNRDASGTAYSAKKGDIVYFNDYNYVADDKRCKIIWLGENRGYGNSDSPIGDPANADDRKRLIAMLKTAISAYECHRFIVVSPPVRTNEELEAEMQQEFGIHFFNDRMYMVNHGIDDAIALGYLNPSTYPTAGDLEDMANGICPRSLRADATHYTENGYYTFAFGLYKHILKAWNL